VLFIEQPRDVRALAAKRRGRWLAALVGRTSAERAEPGVEIVPRATLVPAHLGRMASMMELALLRRAIERHAAGPNTTVVATTPWQWGAAATFHSVRRVFDCADDWGALLPRQRRVVAAQYRRIGAEADAVIVNAKPLASLFGSRRVNLIPNGASPEVLGLPISPPPAELILVYAGTLSERFDVALVIAFLERLPEWRLELYGECRYARQGARPAPELRNLLTRFSERLVWHGPVERTELASCLDAARVLVLPHRRVGAVTGDSMKLYDYAARGRPIVSTRWSDLLAEDPPPHLRLADTPEEFAVAVRSAADDSPGAARDLRAWAEAHSWDRRWPDWSQAAFGA
jgi:glycosyltransferase involved in cell wall biosynthesis